MKVDKRQHIQSDAAHGNRGGGALHNLATADVAGFMSAADKAAHDTLAGRVMPYTLAQSGALVSVGAVTTEAVLATITVPGGAMGPNGRVEVRATWAVTNSANNKLLRVRFGGISGVAIGGFAITTQVQINTITSILNKNSESSQQGAHQAGAVGSFGQSTVAALTSTVDTSEDFDLVITGQKAVSGETLQLQGYQVIVHHWP